MSNDIKICEPQFKKKMLSLHRQDETQFYTTQWSDSRTIYCLYRAVMLCYLLGWLIYFLIVNDNPNKYMYITDLSELWMIAYALVSLLLAIYGKVKENQEKEHGLSPHIIGLVWCMQTTAYYLIIFVTIFFWILIYGFGHTEPDAIAYHKHVAIAILIVIDILVVANDVHYLHAIYAVPIGLLYAVLTLILHWTGVNSKIYPQLDWVNGVPMAATLCIVGSAVVPWITHLFVFGIYIIKRTIYVKTTERNEKNEVITFADVETGSPKLPGLTNLAYET